MVGMGTIKIQMTYEVVTPESAEDGDFADHGFAEPGGWTYSIADESFEERCKSVGRDQALKDMTPEPEEFDTVAEAVEFLSHYGPFEASCYPLCKSGGHDCWVTQADSDVDYSTGAETRLSFHLEGVSRETRLKILGAVL
jgi:hypothetical protein